MKYFIGYMVTIGLLILLIVFLIKSGGNNGPAVPAKTLDSHATSDADVSYLNSGPINAESLHREIKITVDNDYVTYQEIAGVKRPFDEKVVVSQLLEEMMAEDTQHA